MSLVRREDLGRIAVLTLCNPPANGYSHAMHLELDAHIVALRFAEAIDVIVLRGEGERFFCAGADIDYLRSLNPDQKYAFCLHANETLLRMEHTPKLIIAALNGHCVGGGLEIALACDLRIGRASGDKPNLVGLPEVNLGVLPGTGGTQRLSRIIGRARALQWMLEGRNVSVEEALEAGVIHRVLPVAGWWEAVLTYAQSFCRPHRSAQAVGLIKRAVLGGSDLPLESGLQLERELQQRLFAGPDAREGLDAFLGKRKPNFTGSVYAAPAEPRPEDRVIAHPEDVRRAPSAAPPPEPPRPSRPPPDPFATGSSPREEGAMPPPESGGRIDLSRTRLRDDAMNLVSRDLVEKYLLIPVRKEGSTLIVACAAPSAEIARAVADETGLTVKLMLADEFDISIAISQNYRA